MERAVGESRALLFVVSAFSNAAACCMFAVEMIPTTKSKKVCLRNLYMDKRYFSTKKRIFVEKKIIYGERKTGLFVYRNRRADIEISFFVCVVFSQSQSLYLFFYFFCNLFT